jgi:methylglutaconyl-CoA hydratase
VVEGRPIDAGLRAETSRRIAERRASDEAKEGLSAFLQKRKPRWAE